MRALVMIILVGIAAVAFGWAWLAWSMARPIDVADDGIVFELPPGAHVTGVARRLSADGIMTTPKLAFRVHARLTRSRGVLKAGEYRLHPGMSSADVLALLRSGRVIQRSVTFVEGWTFARWRSALAELDGTDPVVSTLTNKQIMARLGNPDLHPEGQFFPDTYQYTKGESDLAILRRAHRRMVDTVEAEWARREPLPVIETRYEALILASIVEKETGHEPDRAPIAGVFVNRLNAGMRLQSDPTVIYGIDDFDGNLRRSDLRAHSPYNTYVIEGLPPTPICNPGLASIRAVMNPQPGPYYYFVSRGDGRSQFSVTLEEHNEAVARYQTGYEKGDSVE